MEKYLLYRSIVARGEYKHFKCEQMRQQMLTQHQYAPCTDTKNNIVHTTHMILACINKFHFEIQCFFKFIN